MSRTRDKVIATHEAGHVVLSLHLGLGVSSASIDRDKEGHGAVVYSRSSLWLAPYVDGKRPARPIGPGRRAFVTAHLLACWGGFVAEGLTYGQPSLSWRRSWDEHEAGICAKLLGCADVHAVVASFEAPARAILAGRMLEVCEVARALVKFRSLSGAELRRIVKRERGFTLARISA
ncbi:MAG: hypothetical protein ACLP1X_07105 [Polyangiaceae bacterium]|jgi:hypothetical protein